MRDYYSVISRAVSNLSSRTVEARWAVYDKACIALQEKLLTLDPPISEEELANERSALEASIRRVEQDVLLVTMRQFVNEDASRAAPSLNIISTAKESLRSKGDKPTDVMTVVRNRLRSSSTYELFPAKAEIATRLAGSMAFVQRMQLQTKALGRRIYLSISGDKHC
jgi:hypothetical protein